MTWRNRLVELEITPSNLSGFEPLSPKGVKAVESAVRAKLPESYRDFLLEFGESDFEVYAVFPTQGGGVAPGTFFGRNLTAALEQFSERMPDRVLPINDDGAQNLICISLRPENYGTVLFQSHAAGWDDSTGDINAAELGSFAELCSSFEDFVLGLIPDD